jgi:hypothetical protein
MKTIKLFNLYNFIYMYVIILISLIEMCSSYFMEHSYQCNLLKPFYAPGYIVIEPSRQYEVNINQQVGGILCSACTNGVIIYTLNSQYQQVGVILCSACTNGIIIYTLNNQYKVNDLGKLHKYGFHLF